MLTLPPLVACRLVRQNLSGKTGRWRQIRRYLKRQIRPPQRYPAAGFVQEKMNKSPTLFSIMNDSLKNSDDTKNGFSNLRFPLTIKKQLDDIDL